MDTLLNILDKKHTVREKDIIDISLSYVEENNNIEYLDDIIFDSNSKYLGYYNVKSNVIVLNDDKIIRNGYRLYDELQRKYHISEDSYTYFLNYYYLYIIYHELTHVSQKTRYERNIKDENIYNYLYDLCAKLRKSDVSFYNYYHDIFPMEIEADNIGCLKAYNILSNTKLPIKEIQILYLKYLSVSSLNYEKKNNFVISPIDKLNEENSIVDIKRINELVKNSSLSVEDRLNLGLGISITEYNELEKAKKKLLSL